MDSKGDKVTLYSSQTDGVVDFILAGNAYYVKMAFIKRKYEEVANIFVNAYRWYSANACKIVEKSVEAESAVWAFRDLFSIERHHGSKILELQVPVSEVVFFDMADWTKILNMSYIGLSKEEEDDYKKRVFSYGVRHESDVVTTPFYPLFKRELYESWRNLFRHDSSIKTGEFQPSFSVQAGLWMIDRRWVRSVD